MASKYETWRCPVHGPIEPHRWDKDWPWEDEGTVCPVLMADESCCGEQMGRCYTSLAEIKREFFPNLATEEEEG